MPDYHGGHRTSDLSTESSSFDVVNVISGVMMIIIMQSFLYEDSFKFIYLSEFNVTVYTTVSRISQLLFIHG